MSMVAVVGEPRVPGRLTDAESMQPHGQSEAMQSAMAAFAPLAAGPPQMTMTTPVAAVGLDP